MSLNIADLAVASLPRAYKRTSGKITQLLKYVLRLSNGNTYCLVFNYNVYLTDETPNLKQLVLPRTCDFSREAEHMAMKSSLKENPVEALIESTPKLKMFIIQSTVVSMKALISLLISLENLEAVNIVHSIIMDMSSPDEFNFFNIHDMENDLPPSIMEIGYIFLKCRYERNNAPGFFQVSAIEDRSIEDIGREEEIISLTH
ncbi:hypothetical protein GmHk_15G044394 [Glycine max]|nr:hypothetical protein GmHk_15G044394 [Glycine max]